MNDLMKRMVFSTDDDVFLGYCVVWTANNDGNIKMTLDGYIDFSVILAGRTIDTGASTGTIILYRINSVDVVASIPMTFSSTQASFSTDTLTVVTNECLSSIDFSIEIICTNASEISILGSASVFEIPSSMTYSYDSCG